MEDTFLSIIIPAFNEESRIEDTLEKICQYFRNNSYISEIVVVDDGSTDNTFEIVTKMTSKIEDLMVVSNGTNRGKGYSVRNGFLKSKGQFLLFSDADMSTPIREVEKLIHFLRNGFDIAIGSRGLKESDIVIHQPYYREMMGKVFNIFVRMLAIGDFRDTQCGFKVFARKAALEITKRQRIERFSFDVEMLYIAKRLGYRIREVPIQWFNSPSTKVNAIIDSFRMFTDLIRIRLNDWKGLYL